MHPSFPLRLRPVGFLVLLLVIATLPGSAQSKRLAVGQVKVGKALEEKALADGKLNSLKRVIQMLDDKLTSALHTTRKFQILARSDVKSLLEEQSLSGGTIGNADYLAIASIGDFQDITESAVFASLKKAVSRRILRIGVTLKIYNTQEGALLETADVTAERTAIIEGGDYAQSDGNPTDALLQEVTAETAAKTVQKILDVIYPARVVSLTDNILVCNRGEGTNIAKDQIWNLYAVGEELTDPDTGESLGRMEVYVGKIKITQVTAKFSKGEVLENLGVTPGAILRLEQN